LLTAHAVEFFELLGRGKKDAGWDGNPQPGPKFNYKLAWFERLIAHAAELMASGALVVLAGDYNVVPTGHLSDSIVG
jgi:hypothetical protein